MKNITNIHKTKYLQEISYLTEIPYKLLESYSKMNPNKLMNIIERPEVLDLTARQFEKIKALNEFLSSYSMVKFREVEKRILLNDKNAAGKYFVSLLGNRMDHEVFITTYLNMSFEVIETDIISVGNAKYTMVDLKTMLKKALDTNCTGIMISHNHPGGSLKPSDADINTTNRIRDIFEPLEIKLYDHIIVSGWNFSSLNENGYLMGKYRQADIPYYEDIKVSQEDKYSLYPKLDGAKVQQGFEEENTNFWSANNSEIEASIHDIEQDYDLEP